MHSLINRLSACTTRDPCLFHWKFRPSKGPSQEMSDDSYGAFICRPSNFVIGTTGPWVKNSRCANFATILITWFLLAGPPPTSRAVNHDRYISIKIQRKRWISLIIQGWHMLATIWWYTNNITLQHWILSLRETLFDSASQSYIVFNRRRYTIIIYW